MGDTKNNGQNKNRRRKLLIDKSVQLRYTFLVLFLIILYSSCLGYSLYTNSKTTSKMLIEFVGDNPKLASKLNKVDKNIVIKIAVAMGINALVITYIGIFSTHKLAGPLYRFKKHLEKMKEGDFAAKTHLRKNDLLTDLANDFNETTDKIKGFLDEDIAKIEAISTKIKKLSEAIRKNQIDFQDASIALTDINNEADRFVAMRKNSYKKEA